MSISTTPAEELRGAYIELMGSERRLRGRDQHRDEKLSFAQMRALFRLGDSDEEMTAGKLAKAADLNPASVTGMLDQLEREGIVERRRSEVDRRCVVVRLTDHGRELLVEKRTYWRERWQRRLEHFSDEELLASARVMREIAALLDEL
jgi:DNA-binding MarR family transcriptional regulator